MKRTLGIGLIAAFLFFGVTACKKQTETFDTPPVSEYFPLEVGHNFIYRLDSTVPENFGGDLAIHSYQAKDSIESTFTDNEGRTSYRIFRFIRDTLGTEAWQNSSTFVATPTREKIEYVDNNLRFIKLTLPISENGTWKGNSFIETQDINSPVPFLNDWDYTYSNVFQPYQVLNKTYDTTITVLQHDELSPDIPYDPSLLYQQKIYSIEVYAKNVGLIYKEFLYWTWQSSPPPAKFEDASYGVKLQLISYQ